MSLVIDMTFHNPESVSRDQKPVLCFNGRQQSTLIFATFSLSLYLQSRDALICPDRRAGEPYI